jgi:S1-C subfamily serine protease
MIARGALFELARALEGLPILGCLQGTPAARAGVRYGDILLSVNGRRTKTFGEYIEAKALSKDGMKVVVFRSGESRSVELAYDPNRGPMDPIEVLAELAAMRALPVDITGDGTPS